MDSRVETYKHIQAVQRYLGYAICNLINRSEKHDQSKLVSPEVEIFDEYTPKLASSEYMSEEYKANLAGMKVALDHHYSVNDHHPEFYKNGIRGMGLFALTEMISDWLAAVKRHTNGDIRASIEANQKRFGYTDEFKQILLNTVDEIENEERKSRNQGL